MAPTRPTKTGKSKHAAGKSGIANSKAQSRRPVADGIVRKKRNVGGAPVTTTAKGRPGLASAATDQKYGPKKKKRTYSAKELGIPDLNMITPIGVVKPPGKKKGKEFVDDKESMATIMALVQADKEGQIESKVMKARKMEEIREARKAEDEKKAEERQARFDETKAGLRKKRKRNAKNPNGKGDDADDKAGVKEASSAGTRAAKGKRKSVSFA